MYDHFVTRSWSCVPKYDEYAYLRCRVRVYSPSYEEDDQVIYTATTTHISFRVHEGSELSTEYVIECIDKGVKSFITDETVSANICYINKPTYHRL